MFIRFALVNWGPHWQPFRGLCLLDITSLADNHDRRIHDILQKVKEASLRSNDLSRVDTANLSMWRCTEPTTFDGEDEEKLRVQVLQVFSEKKVKLLSISARIAQLQPEILEEEIFFVEVTSSHWPGANQFEHIRAANRGFVERLKACGYEVIPEDLEDRGWLGKPLGLLPLMYTVYRQYDPNKTELIAKPFRMGANEPYILKYLHSKPSPSPHIISLIETTPTFSGRAWLILPKMHTLNSLLIDSCGVCGREQLSWGLIKGLAYLHEHNVAHRDIRPKNLVCDDDFRLKIIDFDIAMEVHDENTEIAESGIDYWTYWTAPEAHERNGPPLPMYSPIKADRWSCGKVIRHHLMAKNGNNCISKFADQLMANDPQQRPPLPEWHKFLGALFSDVSHIPENGGQENSRPLQDMVEADRESITLPDSKRPRLELGNQGPRGP